MSEIIYKGVWRDNINVTYYRNKLLLIKANVPGDYDIEDFKEYLEFIKSVTKDDKIVMLNDARENYINLPKEAMNMAANDPFLKRTRLANAFVVSSLPNRIIVNFYMKIFKPSVPTKSFSSIGDAKKWLLSYQSSN